MIPSKMIEAVYYVECDDADEPIDPIAIRPTIQSHQVIWEDTGHGRVFHTTKIEINTEDEMLPEKITIQTDKGYHITLVKMTLDLFDKKVKELAAGNPEFSSDKEIQDYYLHTNFNYYGS